MTAINVLAQTMVFLFGALMAWACIGMGCIAYQMVREREWMIALGAALVSAILGAFCAIIIVIGISQL